MKIAVYPGSFDPITLGHMDIIRRSAKVFDKLVVAVLCNVEKKGLFPIEERVAMISKLVEKYDNIEVVSFQGLLVDFMKTVDAQIIVKGLRVGLDFDYELQMSHMNRKLSDDRVETILMMASTEYSYISSSSVREILHFKGDIRSFVPEEIIQDVLKKSETMEG
ncbi:pantetheine-phosphate adenylyltransferase [Proteiniclasticum sp.]|uniref:pantetheine-phosphate adenylyltransferase n=1 Tax=Proteiniclasticum sp. TaxID=2053595 RepID=UPI00289C1FF1|nr:pantetheine-phosphate adenylyltransferase [Proteiniclasticum sp.]